MPYSQADRRVVYFIRADGLGLIKIGVADCVFSRLAAIGQVCPVDLEILGVIHVGARSIMEQRMHGKFRHLRERGEWFREAPELLDFISTSTVPPGPKKQLTLLERRLKNAARREKRRLAAI